MIGTTTTTTIGTTKKSSRRTLKALLALIISALLLAGCGGVDYIPDGSQTQPIATDSIDVAPGGALAPPVGEVSASPQTEASTLSTLSEDELITRLAGIKAEEEALEIDEDNLEADYRTGKVSQSEFKTRMADIKLKDSELDIMEDELKAALRKVREGGKTHPVEGGMDALLEKLRDLERQENELDIESDLLENDYSSGKITREEFITKKQELEIKEDYIDDEKDLIEDELELLGWDD